MGEASQPRVVLGGLSILGASLAFAASLAAQEPGRLTLEPYTLRSYDGRSEVAELGKLSVPESRDSVNGGGVTLAFIRLRSTSPAPGPPIVFLMGGPGIPASVMAPIPPYWQLFQRLRIAGDVILLDQRGVGLSSPQLDCPPAPQPLDSALFSSRAALVAAFRNVYASCAAYWRAHGVHPRAYSVAASADDIEDLRRALGAERVSLLGFSYGTRLALEFARRHPSRLDRLVLQGPEDPDLRYRSSLTLDSLLGRLAELAAVDSSSSSFSAGLRGRLAALLDSLARTPAVVRVRTPAGDSLTVAVGREGLQALVAERVGDRSLPALIATLERGDTRLLAERVQAVYGAIAAGGGSLMGRAADCSAPPSEARVARTDTESGRSILGLLYDNAVVTRGFCEALGLAGQPSSAGPRRASTVRVPALVIVGQLDSQTPVGNAQVIAGALRGSVRLVVENGEHELLTDSVVQAAVLDFLAGRDVSGRRLRVGAPRFLSIEQALNPPRRRGP